MDWFGQETFNQAEPKKEEEVSGLMLKGSQTSLKNDYFLNIDLTGCVQNTMNYINEEMTGALSITMRHNKSKRGAILKKTEIVCTPVH